MRRVSRLCKCSRADAFLGWFKLWRYFDQETDDGFVEHLTAIDIDDMAGVPGIAAVLEDVKWIHIDENGVTIINWERHNGESAKRRCVKTEQRRKQRKQL